MTVLKLKFSRGLTREILKNNHVYSMSLQTRFCPRVKKPSKNETKSPREAFNRYTTFGRQPRWQIYKSSNNPFPHLTLARFTAPTRLSRSNLLWQSQRYTIYESPKHFVRACSSDVEHCCLKPRSYGPITVLSNYSTRHKRSCNIFILYVHF